jgi:hypothetical protein
MVFFFLSLVVDGQDHLMRKIAELDDKVKTLIGTQNSEHVPQSSKIKVYLHFLSLVGFTLSF